LGASDTTPRIVALQQLVGRTPARSLDALLYASYSTNTRLRHAAVSALSRPGNPPVNKAPATVALYAKSRARVASRLLTFLAVGDAREQPLALYALEPHADSAAVRSGFVALIKSRQQPTNLRRRAIAALEKKHDAALDGALAAVFRRDTESTGLRLDAARALAAHPRRAPWLARALWKHRDSRNKRLRRGTQALLAAHFPIELKRLEAQLAAELARRPRPPNRRGFFPLLATSAALGATGFYALAKGGGGTHPGVAALSGGVLASGSAFLLTRKGPITLERFGTFTTLSGWGTLAGLAGGLSAKLDRHLAWPVVGGQVAGVIAGMIAMRKTDWRGGDIAFVNYSTLQAVAGGLGLRFMLRLDDPKTTGERLARGLVGGLAPAAALTLSSIVTRRVDIDARAGALLTYGSLLGGSLGALLGSSAFDDPDASTSGGGFALGEATGYFATLLATQFLRRPSGAEQGYLWMTSASTATALGGAAMMFPELRGRAARGFAAGGLALGAATSALTSRALSLRGRDVPLSLVGSAAGGFIGAFLPGLLHGAERDEMAIGGGVALGAATGLLAGHLVSRLGDVDPRTAGAIAGSTAATSMLGGGIALLAQPETSVRQRSVLIQSLAAAGLVAGATIAPRLRLSGSDVGLTSVLASYAAAAGGIAPALWRDAPAERDRAGGVLAGVGLATIVGASVA
ncbi:MAG: hypothetical protein KC503_19765, partial [Myxococcales bacterium]|nr:hypothetical protein [Myxococcales bacterium]